MENQHRKIKGYRELSQEQINLMNRVKEQGVILEKLLAEVVAYNNTELKNTNAALATAVRTGAATDEAREETERLTAAEPGRWVAIAKTELQQGLMALTRSIAQPGFF